MELFYPSLLFTFLLILLKLTRRIRSTSNTQNPDTKLPPGPPKLPIIGSMHHLLRSLPHHALRDLAKTYGPLMHLKLGEVSTLVVSSPEAAREIMRTQDVTFASRPEIIMIKAITYGGRDLIFAPYGDYWRQLRKICMLELLSAKRVQSFQSIREEEVFNLVRSIYSTNSSLVNLSKMLNSLTNDITSRAAFGNKCKDQTAFLLALKESLEAAGGFDLGDLFPSSPLVGLISGIRSKSERSHRKLDEILDRIIQEHNQRKKISAEIKTSATEPVEEDLVDVLLRVQEQGGLQFPLSTDSIKAVVLDMFGAGSETSATALEWAISELMRNPSVMKRAQSEVREGFRGKTKVTEADTSELNYLKLVIKETLRLHPPLPLLLPRENQKACEVLGYEIPAKTRVVVNAWAMGRDPQYWDDPEAFKPERFDGSSIEFKGANFEFIPFGAGRRICPGILFGLAIVEHALAQLLYYFDWELPQGVDPSDLDMTETFGPTAARRLNLILQAIPIIPCPMA